MLQIVSSVPGEKINIKSMVQSPSDKFEEIKYIRELIKNNAINTQDEELHNYLGNKFDPVTVDGQVIKPPLIQFDESQTVSVSNGIFEVKGTSPYSKVKELKKIDVYLLDLNNKQAGKMWLKLKEAAKNLGITFKEEPNFYPINNYKNFDDFYKYINDYFQKCDEYYSNKQKNETDFIFLFMLEENRENFHYRVFKSVINKFNWSIPTQVVLYNEKKLKNPNLTKFTNILCQI